MRSLYLKKNILRECISLPYSGNKNPEKDILEDTASKLEVLYHKYGIANVLGELSCIWSFEDAVLFFKNTKKRTEAGRRIQTIATSYHKCYGGGVERVNAELMRIWTQMGLKVVLYTEEGESTLDFYYPQTVKRIIIPGADTIKDRLVMLEKTCKMEQVDLFVNHDWTNPKYLWECALMKATGIKYVQYCHGHFAWNFNTKQGIRQAESFCLCDVIVAISKTNAKFYQMLGCNAYMAANPIPIDLLSNSAKSNPKGDHILMIGRLSHEKHTMEALDIFYLVHEELPSVILDVVGDGRDLEKMKRKVKRMGISESVCFHGNLNTDEISMFYQKASCILFTSRMEGYPMILLEAKAFGVPVVMYDMPYLSLVEDGKGLVSVPAGEMKQMVAAVKSIVKNPDYQNKLAAEARDSFEKLAQHDHQADWRNIFSLCSRLKPEEETDAYYNPTDLPNDESHIMDNLLNRVYHIGEDRSIKRLVTRMYDRLLTR